MSREKKLQAARSFPINHGFTLLELMVVMTIMGLIMAFSAPRITGSFSSVTHKTAAADVAAVLRYARNQAVSVKKNIVCEFDTEQGIVTVKPVVPETVSEEINSAVIKVYTLPPGIEFSAMPNPQIWFYPSGASSGGQVLVRDTGRELRYRCRVDFITGTVRLDEE